MSLRPATPSISEPLTAKGHVWLPGTKTAPAGAARCGAGAMNVIACCRYVGAASKDASGRAVICAMFARKAASAAGGAAASAAPSASTAPKPPASKVSGSAQPPSGAGAGASGAAAPA